LYRYVTAGGEFEADEICVPAAAPQRPPPTLPAGGGAKYVAVVSGLCVGDPAASPPVKLELMLDYISGHLGGAREQATAVGLYKLNPVEFIA
jgi:DNA polymerase delta subunit 2